ncbi:MAG TPA: DUF6448 family protein [Clostridia bacterium]|nr:DUF6448 family protein [Clostridia bacterium]
MRLKILRSVFALTLFFVPQFAAAHCDSVSGPVVVDARVALKTGDLTPMLKWVAPDSERELRAAFERASAVRDASPEVRELGETYFFETAVRLHRASEGQPYTGLKSAEAVTPTIAAFDQALERGNADKVIDSLVSEVRHQLTLRFNEAKTRKAEAAHSVQDGRKYVRAYVQLMHYSEMLQPPAHDEHAKAEGAEAAAHKHE